MDNTIEPTSDARPKQVTLAVRLLLLSIAIGFITSAVHAAQKFSGTTLILTVLVIAVFFGVFLLLVNRISARRNWARIIFLVLVLFGLPFAISNYIAELRRSVPSGLVSMLIAILQLVGTYFLFTKNSNAWFRTRK